MEQLGNTAALDDLTARLQTHLRAYINGDRPVRPSNERTCPYIALRTHDAQRCIGAEPRQLGPIDGPLERELCGGLANVLDYYGSLAPLITQRYGQLSLRAAELSCADHTAPVLHCVHVDAQLARGGAG